MKHIYAAIDLKSFYASVECVERSLDPLTTNLVVADLSRTEKTICLAVSPSLKAYGIPGRARLFEVIERVNEINRKRLSGLKNNSSENYNFTAASFNDQALRADPSLRLSYIVAPPQMLLYEKYSTKIYSIYLKYIRPEDIHVYSIDEVFIDITPYLNTYKMTPHELVMTMIRDVLYTTGITATAGIGTNLYLAKIAMDIVAKHIPADKDGVRLAELDEQKYRSLLWGHRPLTDFWRIGRGYNSKLNSLGLYTMGDIARASLDQNLESTLYKTFGINAELIIDHAWGYEPATMENIRSYRPSTHSISSGQVLKEPYDYDKGALIVREMAELLVYELIRSKALTNQMTLTIGYDRKSIRVKKQGKTISETIFEIPGTGKIYRGKVISDPYGRPHPVHSHKTGNFEKYTNSLRKIVSMIMTLYRTSTDPELLIRRINISACGLLPENEIPDEMPEQLDLFTDYIALEKQHQDEKKQDEKEKRMLKTMIDLRDRYGKNSILRGINFIEGGTTIERNEQIGGHKA